MVSRGVTRALRGGFIDGRPGLPPADPVHQLSKRCVATPTAPSSEKMTMALPSSSEPGEQEKWFLL